MISAVCAERLSGLTLAIERLEEWGLDGTLSVLEGVGSSVS